MVLRSGLQRGLGNGQRDLALHRCFVVDLNAGTGPCALSFLCASSDHDMRLCFLSRRLSYPYLPAMRQIGCDNEDCEHGEWFHYKCVGLEQVVSFSYSRMEALQNQKQAKLPKVDPSWQVHVLC